MLREIRSLRRLGIEIHAASIRNADRDAAGMTDAEREEVESTYYVKGSGRLRIGGAHLQTLFRNPAGYLRGLSCAMGMGRRGLLYFAEAVAVGHWMGKRNLRHVHAHYASHIALILARTFPVSFSATFHGPAEFKDPVGSQLAAKVAASLFCCAISRYGASQLMYACPYAEWPKLEVTPLGVDPDELRPRPFRPNPSPFQIICVGRLAPVKGQHVLLAAMEALVRSRDVRLRLVGDGPERGELQQDAESRGLSRHVIFEGNVNQDRLRELYRESDLFVLPSFAEGLPVVLMEAMAMEIPCVATWVNGVPEIITHEVDGLMAPPGNAEALACAISRLMDDPELRRSVGERGRRKVLQDFDLARNTEKLAGVFARRLQ